MIVTTGKTAGIKTEASLALYQLFFEKYRDTIDNNGNNLPILILKYGDFCKQVVENGDSRLSFYWSEYDKKFGDKKASADLLKDKNSKFDGKSSIFFKCKTKKRGLMATDILKLEPSTGKLFWVEDSMGITYNFPLEVEEHSEKLIRASYSMKKMFAAMESIQQDFDQKQLAELQEMKSILNYFRKILPEKLVKEGVPPDESKKKAQILFDKAFGFKQYVELDRYSSEIRWIQPYQKSPMSRGKDIEREVEKGMCTKMERKIP